MGSAPRVLVGVLCLGLADTDDFFYDDKLEEFSKNIIEELGLNWAFQCLGTFKKWAKNVCH